MTILITDDDLLPPVQEAQYPVVDPSVISAVRSGVVRLLDEARAQPNTFVCPLDYNFLGLINVDHRPFPGNPGRPMSTWAATSVSPSEILISPVSSDDLRRYHRRRSFNRRRSLRLDAIRRHSSEVEAARAARYVDHPLHLRHMARSRRPQPSPPRRQLRVRNLTELVATPTYLARESTGSRLQLLPSPVPFTRRGDDALMESSSDEDENKENIPPAI